MNSLLTLWGPIAIYPFGLMIAFGLGICLLLLHKDKRRLSIISFDELLTSICIATLTGIVGGRVLHILENWRSIESSWSLIALWQGGLSLLGSISAILIVVPWYLHRKKIPLLPFFDLISVYAPLLQAIARVGCFIAGCCYGSPTIARLAVTYGTDNLFAPSCIPLHPAQLYSAGLLMLIFVFMYWGARKWFRVPGQIFAFYLILAGIERFITDFFRGDRLLFDIPHLRTERPGTFIFFSVIAVLGLYCWYVKRFIEKKYPVINRSARIEIAYFVGFFVLALVLVFVTFHTFLTTWYTGQPIAYYQSVHQHFALLLSAIGVFLLLLSDKTAKSSVITFSFYLIFTSLITLLRLNGPLQRTELVITYTNWLLIGGIFFIISLYITARSSNSTDT